MAVTERRRAGWGRVEVGELRPPENIDVPGYQSSTFSQAAQAPVNKDLERLSESLGYFNRNLQALGAKIQTDHKKAATEAAMTRYQTWLSSTTNTEQLEAIRDGRAHWTADPYIGHVARQHYAQLNAQKLAAEIDSDPAYKERLGRPDFDVERYIIEKAAPYTRMMASDMDSAKAFRQGLDAVRSGIIKAHTSAMGEANTRFIEDRAVMALDQAIAAGVDQGLNSKQISGLIRDLYKDLGPRMQGGSLDLKYGRLDDLLIDTLRERAKDPSQARMVMEILAEDRVDTSTGMRLGSLSASARHRDKVNGIFKTATESLGKGWEAEVRSTALRQNSEAFKRGDGSFASIMPIEITNPHTGARLKYSAEEQKHDAEMLVLRELRAQSQGQENIPAEYEAFVKNGIKHPQWFSMMESAFHGIANMNIGAGKGVAQEQVDAIVSSANRYAMLSDGARAYVEKHMTGNAREFFDAYVTMTRHMGMAPAQAATALATAYAERGQQRDPNFEAGRRQEIADAARGLDFHWLPLYRNTPANQLDAQRRVVEIANTYGMIARVDAKKAVDYAKSIIEKNGFVVNGRLVFGVAGVGPGDGDHVQYHLDQVFKQNPAYYKSIGVGSAKDLSVVPAGNSHFRVVGPDGMPVVAFKEGANGRPEQYVPMITPQMVIDQRNRAKDEAIKKTIESIAKSRDAKAPNDRRLPGGAPRKPTIIAPDQVIPPGMLE